MANKLPNVPLQDGDSRRHRLGLATATNELIKVRPPFDRTETEAASSASPVNYEYSPCPADVRRFNATDAGGSTDSTNEIQRTCNALNGGALAGGSVTFPGDANSTYNISAPIDLPSRTSGDNHSRWYSLCGMGRGAPRITALADMTNDPMLDASGQDISTYSFYREIKDLYLNGGGIAKHGVNIYYNQHYKLENLFITGLENGSGTASGIVTFGAICAQFRDIKVHNTEGNGLHAPDGSTNFFNANLIEGCSFLDCDDAGMYFTGGFSGNAVIGNTFETCTYGIRIAGYGASCGFIGGNYLEQNSNCDMLLGEDTTLRSLVVTGNYFNGYSSGNGSAWDDYTPIKLKFANGVVIVGNTLATNTKSPNGYRFLDANISGGAVSNCVVHNNHMFDLSTTTAPNTIYNLPANWVENGNSLIDPTFAPLIQSNLIRGRFPFGGWSISVTGTGSGVYDEREDANLMGGPSLRLRRPTSSTAQVSQAFTCPRQYKNRFVTLAVPILDNVGSLSLLVSVTPNGTGATAAQINVNNLTVGLERTVYVMAFVPSDATTITVAFTANATGTDHYIGHPCLYVGAAPWYSNACDEHFYSTAAPTAGWWRAGQVVFNSAPSAGNPAGWMCSVTGNPGTWVAMANLA